MISIEHAANAVVGAFWLVLATSEKLRIQKRVIVLYLPYCQRTNYILFKMSTSDLFLKFRNFSLVILINYILLKGKECIDRTALTNNNAAVKRCLRVVGLSYEKRVKTGLVK